MTDGKSTKEAVSLKIYESAEDYLEKILMLTERNGEVRSIDIATEMGVTKPSVSIATRIYGRHKKLTRFFVALGVDPVVASHDACKIEHDLSAETFEKLVAFAESQHMLKES